VATILSDGRIAADVRVSGSPVVTVNLIIDTGAEASALPFLRMPAAVRSAPVSRPPVTFLLGGAKILTIRLRGMVAETDVEPHGRGPATKATSSTIRVHFQAAGTVPFVGFDGILGMDMLDDFAADPVKDAAGKAAYLARRV
jgi:hypothetical protein